MIIKKLAVIGAGSMGHQIAMLGALAGYETKLQDISQKSLEQAEAKLAAIMDKWVRKEKISVEEREEAFSRLHFTTDMLEAAGEADLIIEAVVEKLHVKREVFSMLDEVAPSHSILATNSSTIVSSLLADATKRPEKVCNMHFFFPALVMDCVEVVKGDHTSEATVSNVIKVCEEMNRTAVLLKKEISGFIANRILFAVQKEAMSLYEGGFADYEDIDKIVRKALNHPIGPFELMDLSGIDVGYYVMQQQFEESGDPKDKPSKTLEEKMKAGELGRKTGKGFYTYEQGVKS
ncbi:3-hydroxybutyryl-CoA dehydrogenase [Halobacillus karajensis]|uniref:3-hydroxybutyryl-CoA dehydrogenase n=1 Tax=Halobacillus karajensis TaxID=195088 RepID=A0A024P5U4_9BACI|nr:3-hydroxyacyl-CoA dehydrogenase family protein [Halobacillus karajensis]CDQ20500.1 putative 3-hydroxybutyryl-CoA dehydrogenase [Halobacillus karajensis]CDQ24031.1 putative 3-hydroxybutyryl-CoA dehydrogenase [Halobacillus karajensis]CDQ27509.1 putative 3-hydroxybutyryl-CoA dehydrogenase [Halobacillus karajensis]SEH90815.1 3-hydroxybutyryl-CoA dehydrogenase [Halobacillus karajensis]